MLQNDLEDRNSIINETYYSVFGETSTGRLANLSAFLSKHLDANTALKMLEPLTRALDGFRDCGKRITNPSNWELRNLLLTNDAGKWKPEFRKPKVVIDYEVTSKGNLKLTWSPEPGFEGDIKEIRRSTEQFPPDRPVDEIMFIRKFDLALAHLEDKDPWWQAIRSEIFDTYLIAAEEAIDEIENACDVTVGFRPKLQRNNGKIVGFEIISRSQAITEALEVEERNRLRKAEVQRLREAEQARRAAEEAEARALNKDLAQTAREQKYGMPASKIIGLCNTFRDADVSLDERIEILVGHFGMIRPGTSLEFRTDYRAMCAYNDNAAIAADFSHMSLDEAKALRSQLRADRSDLKWPSKSALKSGSTPKSAKDVKRSDLPTLAQIKREQAAKMAARIQKRLASEQTSTHDQESARPVTSTFKP